MAQQNLGERKDWMVRVPKDVNCKAIAAAAGYSSVSRYGADMFCLAAGKPDLMVGPDRMTDTQEAMFPISA